MPKIILVKLLWSYGTVMGVAALVFLVAWGISKIPPSSPWHPTRWLSNLVAWASAMRSERVTKTSEGSSPAGFIAPEDADDHAPVDGDADLPAGPRCPKAQFISRCPDCDERIHTPECPYEKMKEVQRREEERRRNDWRIGS